MVVQRNGPLESHTVSNLHSVLGFLVAGVF